MNNNNKKETVITPQWVTVKEELLNDFFELSNDFSNWARRPTDKSLTDKWLSSLTALYLKTRGKINQKDNFKELGKELDKYIGDPSKLTYKELIKHTLVLCEYIESTGILDVESERGDPVQDFIISSFPQ
jgi:hypothetical protein